jgi:Transposase family tnp2
MDAAWAKYLKDENMEDIFHGDYVRHFKGPNDKLFSLGGDEGQYIFSMSVDFFHSYTNKQAGKKSLIGLISAVCLNLPHSMHYKPENMFLAEVIPGPKEPPLTTLNHYLKSLINNLVDFWQTGVRFLHMFNCPAVQLLCCALLVVICNLSSTWKTAGFASSAHEHFCSVCYCTHSEHGCGDLNYHFWQRQTNNECHLFASQF